MVQAVFGEAKRKICDQCGQVGGIDRHATPRHSTPAAPSSRGRPGSACRIAYVVPLGTIHSRQEQPLMHLHHMHDRQSSPAHFFLVWLLWGSANSYVIDAMFRNARRIVASRHIIALRYNVCNRGRYSQTRYRCQLYPVSIKFTTLRRCLQANLVALHANATATGHRTVRSIYYSTSAMHAMLITGNSLAGHARHVDRRILDRSTASTFLSADIPRYALPVSYSRPPISIAVVFFFLFIITVRDWLPKHLQAFLEDLS